MIEDYRNRIDALCLQRIMQLRTTLAIIWVFGVGGFLYSVLTVELILGKERIEVTIQ